MKSPFEFVVFDLETTGLGDSTEICEFAFVLFRDGKVESTLASRVKPSHNAQWQSSAVKLHGITKTHVKHSPAIGRFKEEIISFVGNRPVFAHNASFDINRLMSEIGIGIEAYCSLRIAKDVLGDMKLQKLDDIARALGFAKAEKHDATGDAIVCGELALEIFRRVAVASEGDLSARFAQHKLRPTLRSLQNAERGPRTDRALRKTDFDELTSTEEFGKFSSGEFTGKIVIFSDLKVLSKIEAQRIVLRLGGFSLDNVSKKTNYLVMGDTNEQTTKKMASDRINSSGGSIRILSEKQFLEMVAKVAPLDDILKAL